MIEPVENSPASPSPHAVLTPRPPPEPSSERKPLKLVKERANKSEPKPDRWHDVLI